MEIIRKWCIPLEQKLRNDLTCIFDIYPRISFLEKLKGRITNLTPWVLEDSEAIATGVFTLIGIYLYSLLHNCNFLEDECIAFVMLYINLDYVLDSKISSEEKKNIILCIDNYLTNQKLPLEDKYAITSVTLIQILENKVDRKILLQTFHEEIKSVKVQYNCDDPQILLETCIIKSKACIDFVSNLLGVQEPCSYSLGKCLQIFDDLFDIDIDNLNNISTIATYTLKKEGYVDSLIEDYLREVEKIPYYSVKIFFCYAMVIYCNSSKYISVEMKEIMRKYYPFDTPSPHPRIKKYCENLFHFQEGMK